MKSHRMIPILCILLLAALLLTACSKDGAAAPTVPESTTPESSAPETEARNARPVQNGILLETDSELPAECQQKTAAPGEASIRALEDARGHLDQFSPGAQPITVAEGSVKGTAEQASTLTLTISDLREISLPICTYTDYTVLVRDDNGNYGYYDTFTLDEAYFPGSWDVRVECGGESVSLKELALEELGMNFDGSSPAASKTLKYLTFSNIMIHRLFLWIEEHCPGVHRTGTETDWSAGGFSATFELDPGAVLDLRISLLWEWAFDQDTDDTTEAALADKADTSLGNWLSGEIEITDLVRTDPSIDLLISIPTEIGAKLDLKLGLSD